MPHPDTLCREEVESGRAIINGCWNFDISKAPKGRMVTRHGVGKAKADIQVFEHEKIWVATDCGKVGTSYFIPDENRWCGFTKGQVPKAWMPLPSHPDAIRNGREA